MKNKMGLLVYKCRQCGNLVKNVHVPNGLTAMINIINGLDMPKEWGFGKPQMYDLHHCSDTQIGVTDLIGFESALEAE